MARALAYLLQEGVRELLMDLQLATPLLAPPRGEERGMPVGLLLAAQLLPLLLDAAREIPPGLVLAPLLLAPQPEEELECLPTLLLVLLLLTPLLGRTRGMPRELTLSALLLTLPLEAVRELLMLRAFQKPWVPVQEKLLAPPLVHLLLALQGEILQVLKVFRKLLLPHHLGVAQGSQAPFHPRVPLICLPPFSHPGIVYTTDC